MYNHKILNNVVNACSIRRALYVLVLTSLLAITSCYYDKEEDLYPASICVTTGLSYQKHIVPILDRNCYICHSTKSYTSSITLEGYEKLMIYVNNGTLVGSIRHQDGFKPMPQAAQKLIDCDMARIEQWILDGALEN